MNTQLQKEVNIVFEYMLLSTFNLLGLAMAIMGKGMVMVCILGTMLIIATILLLLYTESIWSPTPATSSPSPYSFLTNDNPNILDVKGTGCYLALIIIVIALIIIANFIVKLAI